MKEIIRTDKVPAAIGPYSQATKAGGMLFVSGQIPLDPATGEIVEGDVKIQTRQVMENIRAIIEAAGYGFEQVVKCSCFLKDMGSFVDFNEVYAEYFQTNPPARECVEVARLPKDVLVEISVICAD